MILVAMTRQLRGLGSSSSGNSMSRKHTSQKNLHIYIYIDSRSLLTFDSIFLGRFNSYGPLKAFHGFVILAQSCVRSAPVDISL